MSKKSACSLTDEEISVIKSLLNEGWRSQDIHCLINTGRAKTFNSGRIPNIKKKTDIIPADKEFVDHFIKKKHSFDHKTGLNPYNDERLIRAREAMILAVHSFNSTTLCFKTEVFSVLSIIAWTYLLHEFYIKQGQNIKNKDQKTWSLSYILKRNDCPLSRAEKSNLEAVIEIRNEVEHNQLGQSGPQWYALFQACCLNFDSTMCKLFDEKLSLCNEISFALQFCKMNLEQLSLLNKYDVLPNIETLDKRINSKIDSEILNSIEYAFKVIYTFDSASKSASHLQFINPESAEGKEIKNIVKEIKSYAESHPYKPKIICETVSKNTGKNFTSHNHIQAWRHYKIRPSGKTTKPETTKKDYCVYHSLHKDYSYSEKWINFLIEEVSDDKKFKKIKETKI